MTQRTARVSVASWVLVWLGLIAVALAVFDYFWRGNGIHGTGGALLAIASAGAMLVVTGVLVRWPAMPRALRLVLLWLMLIDIVGTGVAAYFLEAWWLLLVMVLAVVAWLIALQRDHAPRLVNVHAMTLAGIAARA